MVTSAEQSLLQLGMNNSHNVRSKSTYLPPSYPVCTCKTHLQKYMSPKSDEKKQSLQKLKDYKPLVNRYSFAYDLHPCCYEFQDFISYPSCEHDVVVVSQFLVLQEVEVSKGIETRHNTRRVYFISWSISHAINSHPNRSDKIMKLVRYIFFVCVCCLFSLCIQ